MADNKIGVSLLIDLTSGHVCSHVTQKIYINKIIGKFDLTQLNVSQLSVSTCNVSKRLAVYTQLVAMTTVLEKANDPSTDDKFIVFSCCSSSSVAQDLLK